MQSIKESYHINEIFPIAPIVLAKQKVYLFFNKEERIDYSLYTDGDVNHVDTWIDKKPGDRDSFLQGVPTVSRYEFEITNANILLIEKIKKDISIRHLYINEDNLYKIINNYLYQISINQKGKIKIKRMEHNHGN